MTKISAATDTTPPLSTDMLALARSGDTTARKITVGNFLAGAPATAFVNAHTFLGDLTIGASGAPKKLSFGAQTGASTYDFRSDTVTFNGVPENIFYWGWNVSNAAAEGRLYHTIETGYYNPAGPITSMEWNFAAVSADHLVSSRPMSFFCEKTTLDPMYWGFRIGTGVQSFFRVTDKTGLGFLFNVADDGALSATGDLVLQKSSADPVIMTLSNGRGLKFGTGGAASWQITGGLNSFGPMTDDTYSIGDENPAFAPRPKDIFSAGRIVAGRGIVTMVKTSAIVDGDFPEIRLGRIAIDTTNFKLYVRCSGGWKSIQLV